MRWALPSGLGVLCAAALTVMLAGTAFAFFSVGGIGTAAAGVAKLTAPTITAATPATGGTVALTWNAVTAPDNGEVTYLVTRNGGAPGGNCPDEATPETVTSCTDTELLPGTYEYKVTARWSTWTVQSAVVNATVTVGPMTKFGISGSTTTPTAGGAVNLTITAQDAKGGTVTTFSGAHSLVFAGASAVGTNNPTVVNSGGTAITFGEPTSLTFTNGVAAVASSKNGLLKVYKAGAASITATEGSFTTPTPLALTVSPAATNKFLVTAASSAPTVGVADNLTITAKDTYGNTATAYTGSKNIVFSGPAAGPNGNVATVTNSSGTEVNIGTATPITFTAGVSTVSAGANGALRLYKSATAASVKATESTITGTAAAITPVAAAPASLVLTSSSTTFASGGASNLTLTAKDTYGNTAVSYTGAKNITFAGASTSPSGSAPTVVNSAGTVVNFGAVTSLNFTSGVAAVASSKNGLLHLYKAETANVTATDGTFTTAPVAITVTVGTATLHVALVAPAGSAASIPATCFFTCAVTNTGNSGTISAGLALTDLYGNTLSNVGASKTATVTVTGGGTVTGTPLTFPETGPATTSTRFTFTYPASGTTSNTVTAAATGYTSATITATK